jgi:hypothetical protein
LYQQLLDIALFLFCTVKAYFQHLYIKKIIEFDAFLSWKDDDVDQTQGKTNAIIKVTGWLADVEAKIEEDERRAEEEEEDA